MPTGCGSKISCRRCAHEGARPRRQEGPAMRLVFVCYPFEDQGSGLALQGYTEAAQALGHEAVVYACPYDKIPLNYSLDIGTADAIVFLFEWTTRVYYGDRLDLARLVSKVL